jgi:hypothetical protein
MFIQVNYSATRDRLGTTYSNGQPARTYTVSVANDWHENDLSIRFEFKPPKRGQNTGDNMAMVSGGEIRIPKRQAIAVATLILLYPYVADKQEPKRMGGSADEDGNTSDQAYLDQLAEVLVRQIPRFLNKHSKKPRGKGLKGHK